MAERRKQDDRLQIRCHAEEKETLQKAADIERRSLSNFVLAAALDHARKMLETKAGGDEA